LKIIFGLFAGFLSGFYGVGGGIVFVPVLLFFLMAQGYDSNVGMLLATGTSLGAIILSSGSSASRHIRFRNVKFETALLITVGVVLSCALNKHNRWRPIAISARYIQYMGSNENV
jgi:uncharacterized membrane protein YfcA